MPAIRIPKTPAAAFDPTRPASSLLTSQIKQLQLAVFETIHTEGEAAEYIRSLTRRLHARHPHTTPRRHAARRPTGGKKKKIIKRTR